MNRYFDAVRNSLSAPDQLILDGVEESDTTIVVRVRARQPSPCPACGDARVSYHSRYERRLRDLPWQGRQVRVHLQTRRFRCRNTECGRKVFAEQVPDVAAPWARETGRLHEVIAIVGYAMGGLPGARLLNRLGMPVSDDTVLRRIKTRPSAAVPTVRVLGVDDWAWRKGLRYGTMLMDLEKGRVIDLLPVRSAESFAGWLDSHPGVEIITRDRSSLYADGGRQGASSAVQITDRYHLVTNLGEAVERDIQQLQVDARRQLTFAPAGTAVQGKRLTWIEARRQRCRQARYDRYLAVLERRRQGHTQEEIAERVGLNAETVARWLNAGEFPERQIRSDRRRDQAMFKQKLERGLHPILARTHYSSARIAALLSKPPKALSSSQNDHLKPFLRFCPQAHLLRRFVLRFRAMLRWRKADKLSSWIDAATTSGFRFLGDFARTLRRDLEAVTLSITSPWNNGPIEGQINRLKVIKRQMYGRAGFELLKARVLPWDSERAA